jgi:hypothetical protein
MDLERWQKIKENIKEKFEVVKEGIEELTVKTSEGMVKQGEAEFMEVKTPLGLIKLSLEKKPLMLDKKFHYSHRAGQSARTEYSFSETEFTYKLKAYKWDNDEDEWKEIDASNFS